MVLMGKGAEACTAGFWQQWRGKKRIGDEGQGLNWNGSNG